ncbi:MAG: Rha family transcriptional regulator, partial [Alcaligenaceae bacterium]|nr:Rha family transcriptional regulator [Alcaligenaceae bacterium]
KSNESNNNHAPDFTIAVTGKDEPRIDSRLIAEHLGVQHESITRLLTTHKNDFKELGILRFQIGEIAGRGQPERYAMLNEDQAYLLLTYSRNTKKVRQLKLRLVQAFKKARQARSVHQTEYLQTYHQLHDAIARVAGGSSNERFIHMNVNKAINQAVGIKPGNRHKLTFPSQSVLVVAQSIACNAMAAASNHKEGYEGTKQALHILKKMLVANNEPYSPALPDSTQGAGHE